jgi:hypothetical protein
MATSVKGTFVIAAQTNHCLQGALSNDFLIVTGANNQNILFGASNTSNIFLKLNSNGYIGIAKSNPAFPLDIAGDLNFTGTLRQNGQAYVGSQWSNQSCNVFLLASNVGIGLSNPQYTLHVNGDIYATGGINAFSDARYKTDLQLIDNALDKVGTIRGYTFNVIDPSSGLQLGKRQAGLLAQDVESILPEVVYQAQETDIKSISYGNMASLFVEAFHEMKQRMEQLEQRLARLEA